MTRRSSTLLTCAALFGAFLITPVPATAQTRVGVEGGVNVANVDFDSDLFTFSFDSRVGGVGGFFVAWDFGNPGMGLQVDALYSQKGTKASDAFFEDFGELEVRIDYLEIPVLLRGNLRASDSVTVRFLGGPSFAFKLSDTQTFNGVDLPGEEELDVKSYDIALAVGAAVQFGRFFVDGRYTLGFINIDDDPEDADFATIKNRAFTFMVGFSFN